MADAAVVGMSGLVGLNLSADDGGAEDVELGSVSMPPKLVPPVVIVWKNLEVFVHSKDRLLLKKVSGKIPGGFTAIMGPSGSGKTTLLNTLACRLDRNTKCVGEIRCNGKKYTNADLKAMSGYVMQDDLLSPHLTVLETLSYAAKLRLPRGTTKEARMAAVAEALKQVGIPHRADVIVGSAMKKGISGGERKRLCVAMELITSPPLLFLDEPTSGLDSVTALSLCELLKELASSGKCTVVCTIHQPQTKIFDVFDNLMLLKQGHIAYQGAASDALQFFADAGYPCPQYTNPADHLLDAVNLLPDYEDEKDGTYQQQISKDMSACNTHVVNLLENVERSEIFMERDRVPWTRQFLVLFGRCMKEHLRRKITWLTQLVQTVVIAILIGTVWLNIGDSTTSPTPVLFFCAINQGMFGALAMINSFPSERVLSLRERAAGTYYCSAYFLAKNAAETISQAPFPIIFSITVYFLLGLRAGAGHFFIFMAFMFLCANAATSLALLVSAFGRTTDMSVAILPMALELCRLFGSFFISPASAPNYFRWILQLSYVSYTYTGTALNQLNGLVTSCDPPAANCKPLNGDSIIDTLGLDYLTIGQCAGILVAYIFICRAVAYLGVRFIKW